jgi:hypothetical protein
VVLVGGCVVGRKDGSDFRDWNDGGVLGKFVGAALAAALLKEYLLTGEG